MTALFVVAHPDDEILGACGTIVRLKGAGDRVAVLTMSERSATRPYELEKQQQRTLELLGVDAIYTENYEAMRFGTYSRYGMTAAIENVLRKEEPDVLFTHDASDIHNDHRLLASVVFEASKMPLRGLGVYKPIRGIYAMEIPSSSDWGSGFLPNAFYGISEESIALKARALEEYDDVIRDIPHPRNYESFKALARYRGGQCGCEYAEAFRKIAEVNP